MSNESTAQTAAMDPMQAARMDEVMRRDLRERMKELEALKAEKAAIIAEREEREAEYTEMRNAMEAVKDEKRRNFSEIVTTQVNPFMEGLKKDQSPNIVRDLSRYEEHINAGLENAFMSPDEQAMYTTVTAAASQLAATSSELEKMFQSDKAWSEKYGALQKERDEIAKANEEAIKEAAVEKELKERMLEDLKKELSELKSLHSKNMMSVDNMLEKKDGDGVVDKPATEQLTEDAGNALEQPAVVSATASNNKVASYDSIYAKIDSYKPVTNWRTNRGSRF